MSDPRAEIPATLTATPITSIYVWGSERATVNRAARRVARRLDPEFVWLEADAARGPPRSDSDGHPAESFAPRELLPRPGVPEEVLWTYLRPWGQRCRARELQDFLRMPEPVQCATASLLEREGTRVLVVANVDLLGSYDPDRRGFYGQFVEFLNSRGITLVVTSAARPQRERLEFEYSVTTPAELPERYRTTAPLCQWGDCNNCLVRSFFSEGELACSGQLALQAFRTRAVEEGAQMPGFASH
jgi:hypothetical protein